MLAAAVIEARLDMLTDAGVKQPKRVVNLVTLMSKWRPLLLASAQCWMVPGRQPEAGDLDAHNNYAFLFSDVRKDIGQFHARQMLGRVSQIPWAYYGDPLEAFAEAFPAAGGNSGQLEICSREAGENRRAPDIGSPGAFS